MILKCECMKNKYLPTLTLILFALFTASCTNTRHEQAIEMLAPSSFQERLIPASSFLLTTFERITNQGDNATVYIEGDGLAWTGRRTPSLDPTPTNPVALRLATEDQSANVIYLARPCQYSKLTHDSACPQKYWTSSRFAPEVVKSMNIALNDIQARYKITGFNIVGFSGGANVAALMAAQRDDILSLRTVAGNLDHRLLHSTHNVSQLSGSLNAADIAPQIAYIPQHHFIGGKDNVVPPAIAESFINTSGDRKCIRSTIVPNATHEKGWSNIWPALLEYPVDCQN